MAPVANGFRPDEMATLKASTRVAAILQRGPLRRQSSGRPTGTIRATPVALLEGGGEIDNRRPAAC